MRPSNGAHVIAHASAAVARHPERHPARHRSYAPGYGSITVDGDFMPVQPAAWSRTDRLPMLDTATAEALTGAGHVCSYDCFFSQCWAAANGAPVGSSCLLVNATAREEQANSYCYGGPRAGRRSGRAAGAMTCTGSTGLRFVAGGRLQHQPVELHANALSQE